MPYELLLTHEEFLSKGRRFSEFHSLISTCMQIRGVLVVELTSQGVRVCVQPAKEASAPLSLVGHSKLPGLNLDAIDKVGAKLIIPLLLDIQTLSIQCGQIYYLGREFRSIAEFFARNLLLASSRNVNLDIRILPKHPLQEPAKQFKYQYLHILREAIPEDKLKSRNAKDSIDLIELNACLDSKYFSHALLNCNLGNARADRQSSTAENALNELKKRFFETRSSILVQR